MSYPIPSAVLTGLAAFTGVGGKILYASVGIYPLQDSLKFTHQFELEEGKSPNGFDMWWAARNEHYMLDIGMKCVDRTGYDNLGSSGSGSGSAGTVAHAITGTFFATPISTITLSGFGGADHADIAWVNDVWQVLPGGDIDLSNLKTGEMRWKLRKYTNTLQQALLAATPGS